MNAPDFILHLQSRGHSPRKSGAGWSARCPGHDDHNASLSISTGADGRILLKCHAGCSAESIVAALGLTLGDLFPPRAGNGNHSKPRIVAAYDYHDENGKLLFQCVRFEPKDFRQRRPDPAKPGEWIWNLKDTCRVLYRLREVKAAIAAGRTLFVAEGEKDCDALVKHGFVATCNPMGAGKWLPEHTATLAGASRVAVIADKDTPGRNHAQAVASGLHAVAKSVKVIELPDVNAQTVKDAFDFFASGGTADALRGLVKAAPEVVPAVEPPPTKPGSAASEYLSPGDETGDAATDEAALNRLAALPLLEYEHRREAEAERLNIRVSILDAEVQKRRQKSGESLQGGTMSLADLEAWPEAVDGAALLDEVRAINNRFIVLPMLADVLLTIWDLHTYVFDCFSYTPYLHVTSPEKECGKSTLGELMNHLCANATTPGGMSAAAMFRRIESRKPTLLLDEWDTLSDENRQAALNVLNTGFKWNGVYTICDGDDHEVRDFHTFCPKAIFGLSEAKLPDTTRSRCFALTLQKKLPDEKVEKLTRKFDGSTLRRKCLRWANDNRERLKNSEPVMPPGLSARQEDIAEPLLAIADACGGHWPEIMRAAVTQFFGDARSDEGDIKRELLKDIQAGFKQQDPADRWSSAAIRVYLNLLEHRPWVDWNDGKGISQRQISDRLRSYRITSHNIKLPDGTVPKGYYLTDFEDAFARYLPPNPDAIRYPATKPESIGDNSLFQSATKDAGSGCENAETANKINDGSGVADETPVTAEAMLL